MKLFSINIYGMNPILLAAIMLGSIIVLALLNGFFHKSRTMVALNIGMTLIGLYGIMAACVFGRVPTHVHQFVLFSLSYSELFREMFMNLILFIPFAQGLSCLIWRIARSKKWKHYMIVPLCVTVLAGLLLTSCIELWQFIFGTGTAQLSDVFCNALGALLGTGSMLLAHAIMSIRLKQRCNQIDTVSANASNAITTEIHNLAYMQTISSTKASNNARKIS